MKRKKILISLVILCISILISNFSSAISISMEDKKVKPGEEFTLEIKTDEGVVLGNSHIIYNGDLIEFAGTTQNNLSANEINPGDVAWMYTDMNESSTGTNKLEFKFKVKDNISKNEKVEFKLSDLVLITTDNQYVDNEITGDKEFNVTITNEEGNLFAKIIIAVVIIAVIVVAFLIIKSKKTIKSRH